MRLFLPDLIETDTLRPIQCHRNDHPYEREEGPDLLTSTSFIAMHSSGRRKMGVVTML